MPAVGVLATFRVNPGREGEVADFFREGLLILETQPPTTSWFAFQVDGTTYGAFAVFAEEADRDALLAAGGPRLAEEYAHIFAGPPSFEKVDILQARNVRV